VQAPEVAFVRASRLVGSNEDAHFPFAPDLAVEVASCSTVSHA